MPNLYSVIFSTMVVSSSALLLPQDILQVNQPAQSGEVLGLSTTAPELGVFPVATDQNILSLAEESRLQAALNPTESAAVPVASPLPPTPQPSPVPTPSPVPATPQLPPHELDALFQKYGTEYGVSWEKLKVMAQCESGMRANAIGGGGRYGGMYQYVASTWVATRNAMGLDSNPDLRFNAEEAIRTTAWKIAHGGLGAWPVCGKK